MPLFEQGRIFLPRSLHVTNYEKVVVDNVRTFVEEDYLAFPVGSFDDMSDSLSRICEPDLKLVWPKDGKVDTEVVQRIYSGGMATAWMA